MLWELVREIALRCDFALQAPGARLGDARAGIEDLVSKFCEVKSTG